MYILIMKLTLITFTYFVYNPSDEDYTGCAHWSRQGIGGRGGSRNFKCHLNSLFTAFWGGALLGILRKCWMVIFSRQRWIFFPSFICCVVIIAFSTVVIWLGILKSGKGSNRIQFLIYWSYIPLNTGNIIPVILVNSKFRKAKSGSE